METEIESLKRELTQLQAQLESERNQSCSEYAALDNKYKELQGQFNAMSLSLTLSRDQFKEAYQKAVADGLELKRQRDEWKEDADNLAMWAERQSANNIGWAMASERKALLAAHTKLEQQEKEKKV